MRLEQIVTRLFLLLKRHKHLVAKLWTEYYKIPEFTAEFFKRRDMVLVVTADIIGII